MEQEVIDLISALGSSGERAFYVYLIVHNVAGLLFFGVAAVGVYHLFRYMLKHS